MPFALLIVGAFLLIAAVRGTTDGPSGLFALVAGDFTGSPNFTFWVVAILLIGVIGYVQKIKPLSDAMLVLVILVLFLSKGNPGSVGGGFFNQFTAALGTTTTAAATPASTTPAAAAPAATSAAAATSAPAQASYNPFDPAASNSLPLELTSLPAPPPLGITENL